MFHIASGLIHLLLLFAVISFMAHLVMGTSTGIDFSSAGLAGAGANRLHRRPG